MKGPPPPFLKLGTTTLYTYVESRKRSLPASFAEMMPLELTRLSESLQTMMKG